MGDEQYVEETLLNQQELDNCIQRLAFQIIEKHSNDDLAFVGIHTRGVPFAERLYEVVVDENPNITRGTLDITLYRDDLDNLGTIPSVQSSDLPFEVEGSRIVLLDDVIFTGRTIRAAIDVIMDYGRPDRIELGALVDRGHRELPICPDYTGLEIETTLNEYVNVRFQETDEQDGVFLVRKDQSQAD